MPKWRRRWDSNPRYAFTHNGFQDRRLRPLGHSSRKTALARMTRPRQRPKPRRSVARKPCRNNDDSEQAPTKRSMPEDRRDRDVRRFAVKAARGVKDGHVRKTRCPFEAEWRHMEKRPLAGTHVMQLLKSPRTETSSQIARSSRQNFMTTKRRSMLWPKGCPKKTPIPARGAFRRETS